MRDGPAGHVAVVPDPVLNWVLFATDRFDDGDLLPHPAAPRSRTDEVGSLRELTRGAWLAVTAARRAAWPVLPGLDEPGFDAVPEPEVRRRLRERWPEYLTWWRDAKRLLVEAAMADHVRRISADVVRELPPDVDLTVYVAAVRSSQDLASRHVSREGRRERHEFISHGLLADERGLGRWLREQLRDLG